jgi:hypothetical protein
MHVLRQDDKELFIKILNDCCKYSKAINAKASHPTEVLLMAIIVLYQARTIRLSPIICLRMVICHHLLRQEMPCLSQGICYY